MLTEKEILAVPAPWQLDGSGYILVYNFPQDFVREAGFLPPALAGAFVGGPGAVMLVDYQHSDAGPYQELLFTPGQFQVNGRRFYSITKIYVSTWESVVNGRRNWGIPKEFADFALTAPRPGVERVQVSLAGQVFAAFEFQTHGWSLPVTTSLVPSALRTLIEPLDGKTYFTAPSGRGQIRRARLEKAEVQPAFFPNIAQFCPLVCVRASGFALQFPLAEITEVSHAN